VLLQAQWLSLSNTAKSAFRQQKGILRIVQPWRGGLHAMTKNKSPAAGDAARGAVAAVTNNGDSSTEQIVTEQGRQRRPRLTRKWQFNDGGRAAAGFHGETGDCVCRAIAIATGKPYAEVYDELSALGWNCWETWNRSHRTNEEYWLNHSCYCDPATDTYLFEEEFRQIGFWRDPDDNTDISNKEARRREDSYLKSLGWEYAETSGIPWHALPAGRLIVQISGHLVAVIDGVIHDTFDCSRGGTACIEGYWSEH